MIYNTASPILESKKKSKKNERVKSSVPAFLLKTYEILEV